MSNSNETTVRRLVLVRPSQPEARGVRRLLLARSGDALLPAPRSGAAAPGVRAP